MANFATFGSGPLARARLQAALYNNRKRRRKKLTTEVPYLPDMTVYFSQSSSPELVGFEPVQEYNGTTTGAFENMVVLADTATISGTLDSEFTLDNKTIFFYGIAGTVDAATDSIFRMSDTAGVNFIEVAANGTSGFSAAVRDQDGGTLVPSNGLGSPVFDSSDKMVIIVTFKNSQITITVNDTFTATADFTGQSLNLPEMRLGGPLETSIGLFAILNSADDTEIQKAYDYFLEDEIDMSTSGPESEPTGHTHWRVRRLTSDNTFYVGLAELDFAGVEETGGTVLFSSEYNASTFAASNAFDKANPAWVSEANQLTDAFIGYQFTSPVEITELTIKASTAGQDAADYTPRDFVVEYSDDGTTWTESWTETGTAAWTVGQSRTFTKPAESEPTGHTHWRIVRITSDNTNFAAVAELDFIGADETGGTPLFSTEYSATLSAAAAFDKDTSTRWITEQRKLTDAFIGYQFSSPVSVNSLSISSHPSLAPDYMIRDFKVQYSDDGTTWTDHWTETGVPAWSTNETRIFTKPEIV